MTDAQTLDDRATSALATTLTGPGKGPEAVKVRARGADRFADRGGMPWR